MRNLASVIFLWMVFLAVALLGVRQSSAAEAAQFLIRVTPELPFAGDRVTIAVIPQNFDTASTTFSWFRDSIRLSGFSGVARATATLDTDPTRPEVINIRVEADPGPDFAKSSQSAIIHTVPSPKQLSQNIETLASEFNLEASSLFPSPGEAVNVSVVTFAFDRGVALFDWRINGEIQRELSGRGRYQITVPAGAEGESKAIGVTVTTPGGTERAKSLTVRTASAPLYWWADTTAPHWYKGKALPSLGSRVTLMTLANGRDPGELNYQWQFNDSVVSASSGFNRPTFSFVFTLPIGERVSVSIKDAFGSFEKSASLTVGPIKPSAGIYEVRPLRGVVFENRISSYSAPAGETRDFLAETFGFPANGGTGPEYQWMLNGEEIKGVFTNPRLFTLKSNRGELSQNQLTVEVRDLARDGERSSAFLQIDFR